MCSVEKHNKMNLPFVKGPDGGGHINTVLFGLKISSNGKAVVTEVGLRSPNPNCVRFPLSSSEKCSARCFGKLLSRGGVFRCGGKRAGRG